MSNQSDNKRLPFELIAKLVVGLLIAGLLAALVTVVITHFPTNDSKTPQGQEQQETIIKLFIKSNENIAQLQREQEIQIERGRLVQMANDREQNNFHHLSEQTFKRNLTYEFLQRMEEVNQRNREEERFHQWTMEQQRISIAEKYRHEDQNHQSEYDLNEFLDKTDLRNCSRTILQRKILGLIRRLKPLQKSVLIKILYEENLLYRNRNSDIASTCTLDLQNADLSEIQLGKKDENDCYLVSYNNLYLVRTNLVNASFDCLSLEDADLTKTNLSNASFFRSRLYNASLFFSDLSKCNFQEAQMDGLTLIRSSLLDAQFQRASLVGANLLLIEGNGSDFREANLAKSSFTNAVFTDAKFDFANISEINLGGVHLENASFFQVFGERSNFGFSHITNTSFRQAHLHQSEFYAAEGVRTDFSSAVLDGSNFRYTNLYDCVFYNASMNNISLLSARIINSNLRRASLMKTDFTQADLILSDFSEANLNGSKGLTKDQLDTVFSISNAILPDGTRGKNRNLIKYGRPICNNTTIFMNRSEWILSSPTALIITDQLHENTCVFQSATSNRTTMSQPVDISGYVQRMIQSGSTNILIEIALISGQIHANLRLFNWKHDLITEIIDLFYGATSRDISAAYPIINSTTFYADLEVTFLTIGTAVNNIHLSIEV